MSLEGQITRATLTAKTGPRKDKAVTVHFNPVSLEYTVANTVEKKGSGDKAKQFVSQTSGKLSFQILFDTTDDGSDVRAHTEKIAALMQPDEQRTPAIVLFEWGRYKFQGMLENYKETLDFFAPSGVPLRASLALTLAAQDVVFSPGPDEAPRPDDAVQVPPGANGVQDTASQAGDPRAARDLGAANGEESLRFPTGLSLEVSASVTLKGPVAFSPSASLKGGLSLGGSLDVSLSGSPGVSLGSLGAGFGGSSSGGFGVAAGLAPATRAGSPPPLGTAPDGAQGAGPTSGGGQSRPATSSGAPLSGTPGAAPGVGASGAGAPGVGAGAASPATSGGAVGTARSVGGSPARAPGRSSGAAGVPAREGAFAGLRNVPAVRPSVRRLDVVALRPAAEPTSTDQSATFEIGGRAHNPGPMSLGAGTGLKFDKE